MARTGPLPPLPSGVAHATTVSRCTSNPATREKAVDKDGLVHAPSEPGIALPAGLDYPPALHPYVQEAV